MQAIFIGDPRSCTSWNIGSAAAVGTPTTCPCFAPFTPCAHGAIHLVRQQSSDQMIPGDKPRECPNKKQATNYTAPTFGVFVIGGLRGPGLPFKRFVKTDRRCLPSGFSSARIVLVV